MNKIILTGNLVKDSELSFIPGTGTPVTKFIIANNVGFGDKQRTNYVNCVLFGKRAESMVNLLIQGTKVLIEGELDVKSKQKDNGTWVNYTNVTVNDIEITKFINKEVKEEVTINQMTPVSNENIAF